MIIKNQEKVILFEYGFIVLAVLNVFDIYCADVVYPLGENLSLFTNFCPEDFIHVYNM